MMGRLQPGLAESYWLPPANAADRWNQLNQGRSSPPPPDSAYDDYMVKMQLASTRQEVMAAVEATLLKDPHVADYRKPGHNHGEARYHRRHDQSLWGFPGPGLGPWLGRSSRQDPDMVEGSCAREYLPVPLNDYFVSGPVSAEEQRRGDEGRFIVFPHLSGRFDAPGDGRASSDEFDGRAATTGEVLWQIRARALGCMDSRDAPCAAIVSHFVTDGETIVFYTHFHIAVDDNGSCMNISFPIARTNLLDSYEGFELGRRQLRNLQEHAKVQALRLRDAMQAHWLTQTADGREWAWEHPDLDTAPPSPLSPCPAPLRILCPLPYGSPSTQSSMVITYHTAAPPATDDSDDGSYGDDVAANDIAGHKISVDDMSVNGSPSNGPPLEERMRTQILRFHNQKDYEHTVLYLRRYGVTRLWPSGDMCVILVAEGRQVAVPLSFQLREGGS
jgi:hypothetical protein